MSEVIDKSKKKNRNKKFDNLIGPTDTKVDNEARERLVSARIGLLLRHFPKRDLSVKLGNFRGSLLAENPLPLFLKLEYLPLSRRGFDFFLNPRHAEIV